jgi:hypothetical protein
MAKMLNMAERKAACRDALRVAVRSVATPDPDDPNPNEWADAIWASLEAQGFRVHYQRVQRNGRAPKGPPMTRAQVRKARALRRKYPRMRFYEISVLVGANIGRVSEALAGMRGDL